MILINIIIWLFCFALILSLQVLHKIFVHKYGKKTIYDYSIKKINRICKQKKIKEVDIKFIIDFLKNPNDLTKAQIADKYNYDEKYVYKKAEVIINKINKKVF